MGEEKGKELVYCFKEGLSKNAIKRIKILKESDDGFIAEEDLKLRGYGDLIGYQQVVSKILDLLILSIMKIFLN